MNDNSTKRARKYLFTFVKAVFVIGLALGTNATAQEVSTVASGAISATPRSLPDSTTSAIPQSVITSLANLPEADTLLYLSPRRIINDAAPRVLGEKELAEMREGLSQATVLAGIDSGNIDYLVLQVRFKKPNANLDFSLPEYMLVVGGDFNADALIELARSAAKEKLREESYGSKTLGLMTIDDLAKQAEKTPLLRSLTEVAFVAVNGNTVAVGSPGYVKAAIDAAAGKGRVSSELLNSVLRDPAALASVAGSPLTAFAKTFALLGTENNPRAPRCDSRLGDFYAAVTMDGTTFKFRGAMNADNPDTAKIIKSLLSTVLQQAASMSNDKSAQSVLSRLAITTTETEVLLQADVSQQAVADFIREQSAPQKPEVTSPPPTTPKDPVKPITRRRRRRPLKTTT